MEKPPLRPEEVQRILRLLEPLSAARRIVLVGGQAVAFWKEFLGSRSSRLRARRPLTSKDVDFEGDAAAAREAAKLLAGRARVAGPDDHTPNTGIVIFKDSDGVTREIDFIDSPLGLTSSDVRRTAVVIEHQTKQGDTPLLLWVMHPERCMESRVHNAVQLGKIDTLAMNQLDVSIGCSREWSRYLLDDDSLPKTKRVRAVLDLNERVFRKCLRDRNFRNLILDHPTTDPFDAVLIDDRLPNQFRQRRYPQMRSELAERRDRDLKRQQRFGHATGWRRA